MKKYIILGFVLVLAACTSSEYKAELKRCNSFDAVAKDQCLQALSITYTTQDPCLNIKQSGVRIPCMVEVAKHACDTDLCENIGESWQVAPCKKSVENSPKCSIKQP